jgi:hypothetical protein
VARWAPDWDAFIRSWAEVYASQSDYDSANDEEEMAELLAQEYFRLDAVPGETVDEFNERLWQYEVEGMMDALSDDFADLEDRIECARTMHLAQYGEAA